ncbi:MAG TPA: LptA/OstA family protein [Edaphobacter sp.]|nr:LptA/OstA family protein [Edaphobacter sp.]
MSVSISIERLRVWLLVGGGLLVMVIAAFLGYAHYRAHRFIKDLPAKLGMDITQDTNGFTWSQSVEGKTLYTIHAAKARQFKDGKVTLHDVGIVLYGRKQDRADRIYGSEFEYDQKAGVIRAMGEVHLDLQAPAAADSRGKADYAAGKDLHESGAAEKGQDDRLIHVKTSGLVFLRELGVAATEQDIEFEFHGTNGHAKGADYSSDTGVLVLHSAVKVNGLQGGRPIVLTAARAELDRTNQRVTLARARYVSVGGERDGGGETAQAQQAIVHMRKDGSAERVEAEGEVTLTEGDGGRIIAQRADAVLNATSGPQLVRLYGGVRYVADEPLRQAKGESAEGLAAFDKAGRLEQVVLTGAVHLNERVRASEAANEPWGERELDAGTVELALAAEGAGKPQLRDAKASGDARLKVVSAAGKGGRGSSSSEMAGDVLTAHFVRLDGSSRLSEVHGAGHTALRRVSETGVEDTSLGDTLDVRLRAAKGDVGRVAAVGGQDRRGKKAAGGRETDEISTAVQQGHVVMTHKPVHKPDDASAPGDQRATAEKAVYDGATERVTLTGGVQVMDAGSVLWADKVAMEQKTGDGVAEGSVKGSYLQPKGGESSGEVHVLAARAELKRAADQAIFYGGGGRPARLWQGGSQVEAPVLQFEQKQRRLVARGEGQGAVHVVMVSGSSGKAEAGKTSTGRTGAVRVTSRELIYSDEERKAEFGGGVQVESVDGRMRGQQATVYLQAAGAGSGRQAGAKVAGTGAAQPAGLGGLQGGFMGGSVERVVVTGQIEMEQPGRRATGEQLVYAASDGTFVLTGTAAAPPKIMDETRGTVTGTSLRFRSGDESVVISNGESGGTGQRVRTETRVKKQ